MRWATLAPWLKSWGPTIVAVVVVGILTSALNSARTDHAAAVKALEAVKLEKAGIERAAEKTTAGLAADVARLTGENADFRAEVVRLAKVVAAKPIAVWHGSSGALRPAAGVPATPTVAVITSVPGAPPPAACLFSSADEGEIRTAGAEFKTVGGNVVFRAVGSCWRLGPVEAQLFGGPLKLEASVEKAAQPLGWGAGLRGALMSTGWALGPALAFPPVAIWRWQVEGAIDGAVGPSKAWQLGGTVIVR